MTDTITITPEELRHHEHDTDPFTQQELAAINEYLTGDRVFLGGAILLQDCIPHPDDLAEHSDPAEMDPRMGTAEEWDRGEIEAAFKFLDDWYTLLDSLYSDLATGPAGQHSTAAVRYLTSEANQFFHTLNQVRRAACMWAFGAAGPCPEVDAGFLTFYDVPPRIQLDGTAVADVDRNERARTAATASMHEPMRHATKGRS